MNTSTSNPVIVIGDCPVDVLKDSDGAEIRVPGGTGLNVSLNLTKFAIPVALLATIGTDEDGKMLAEHAASSGVGLVSEPSAASTGVAVSERVDGEPTYIFNEAMRSRNIDFNQAEVEAMKNAPAIISTGFPLDYPNQPDKLLAALKQTSNLVFLDPNPRSDLLENQQLYREKFEMLARVSSLIKISRDDAALIYGSIDLAELADHLVALGAKSVLVTLSADGAMLKTATGISLSVPIADLPEPIVDAMGGGDATMAGIVKKLLDYNLEISEISEEQWQSALTYAMLVAGATARKVGGALVIPE